MPEPLPFRRRVRHRLRVAVRRLAIWTIAWVGPPFVRWLSSTWKFEFEGREHLLEGERRGGALLTLWHGRMLLGITRHVEHDCSILVSHAKDGEIMHRLLRRFGYGTIRGSSSRGAPRALREMIRDLKTGRMVVVTPDGPRGPRHAMTVGLAWLSRATGYPVVPIGLAASRAWTVSSWDAFSVPKPFARVAIHYGAPMEIGRSANEAEMDAFTESVRVRLIELEESAQAAADARESGDPRP